MTTGLTLALDGSTYAGSVALIRGTEVISERQLPRAVKPGREGREEHLRVCFPRDSERPGGSAAEKIQH